MKAVVMAGGEGTRLRPLTSNQPKPMVPIVGKPCLEHILELLRVHAFDDVVITLAFLPQAIRSYYGDGDAFGLSIGYSVEDEPLGTAGSVRQAASSLDEPFLVISGDALCDVDLSALVASHRASGAAVTIGLVRVPNPLEFGIVVVDEDGRVQRFLEKPSWGEVFTDTVNTGIYVIEPEVLRLVPPREPHDFSKELFPRLLGDGVPIHGHVLDGYWQDIGTLEQYLQANLDALDGRVRLEIPGIRLQGGIWVAEDVDLADLETVKGPAFVGPNCKVAPDAHVGPYAVLARGVRVRERARVVHSVVDRATYVGRSASIEGAIVGRACDIGAHARIHEGATVGDEVTVGAEAVVSAGVRVYPFKRIESGAQITENVVWEPRVVTHRFGAAGAVGRVDGDLTPEVAVRLAASLGTALRRGDRVATSHDGSVAAQMIHRAMLAGLTSTGVHVADLRVSPAAVTRHMLRTQGLAAGIHVSRSSVDPELVQVRVLEATGILMGAALQKEVETHFSRQELRRVSAPEVGETDYPARVRDGYAQDIVDALDPATSPGRRLTAAVDYGRSAAIFTLPLVVGPLGVEVVSIGGAPADESDPELQTPSVSRVVTAVQADLGVVFDRAAERLVLVDERGGEVASDVTLLLLIRLLADARLQGVVVVPVTTTALVEDVVAGSGLRVERAPHATASFLAAATADGVVFAGDSDGGFVFPDLVPGPDAVATACWLFRLLSRTERTVSELVAALPRPTLARRSLECPWTRKGEVMRVLNETLADRRVDAPDGVKAVDERGWVQVVPDPDEPVVLVFAEGLDVDGSAALADEIEALVGSVVQGDDSPGRTPEESRGDPTDLEASSSG